MSALLLLVLVTFVLAKIGGSQATIDVSLSLHPPPGTSTAIHPSFAGFGIEPSNLFSFMGHDSPNQLTLNLLNNLVGFTGHPAHIRLGGNTQDYLVYSDNQRQWTWMTNPDSITEGLLAADHMLVGPNYYAALNRLPANTPITVGLNMAYQADDYVDKIVMLAEQAVARLDRVTIASFELGNEPDLWLQNGFRSGNWSGEAYTEQWLDRASAVCTQVLMPKGLPCNMFEPAATASTINTDFQINDLLGFGIDQKSRDVDSSYIARWNQHDYYYFLGISGYRLTLDHLMTLSTTREQFAAWEDQIQQASHTPYSYALREMGMVGPTGLAGITDTLGAALWTFNFFLYAASLNISHVGMHMTDNSFASAWQPIDMDGRRPHVRPLYYAYVAFDQLIGPSCTARVFREELLPLPIDYVGKVEAYSIFQGDELTAFVVINGRVANMTADNRDELRVSIALPVQFASRQLYLAYLSGEGADATSNVTFNGLDFEQDDKGTQTSVNDFGHDVVVGDDGTVVIHVRDSEAVVAQVGIPVGQVEANPSACSELMHLASQTHPPFSPPSTNSASTPSGWSDDDELAMLLVVILSWYVLLFWDYFDQRD